jgi:flagellar biosynthetic protein FliR
MDLLPTSYPEFKSFVLILVRVGTLLFLLPFFNSRIIPNFSKAGLAMVLTIILYPLVNRGMMDFDGTLFGMGQFVVTEFIIGMTLAIMVQFFFEGIKMMGQLVGFQTGFAITNIIDPQSGIQVSILSNLAYLTALVIFLTLDGHHILITALKESFQILGVGSINMGDNLAKRVIELSGTMFVIALKIGAPAIAALLFTKVAFGLITKLIPQMNIMIVAFPVQIVIGLVFFGISLSLLLGVTERYIRDMSAMLISTLQWFKG